MYAPWGGTEKSPYLREIDKLWMDKMAAGTRGPSGLWGRKSILGEIDKKWYLRGSVQT